MEKMNPLKKMKLKRTMTKNEKMLLILLGIVIIFWATFRFIIIPQKDKLQILADEKTRYEEEISQLNLILKKKKRLKWNGKICKKKEFY